MPRNFKSSVDATWIASATFDELEELELVVITNAGTYGGTDRNYFVFERIGDGRLRATGYDRKTAPGHERYPQIMLIKLARTRLLRLREEYRGRAIKVRPPQLVRALEIVRGSPSGTTIACLTTMHGISGTAIKQLIEDGHVRAEERTVQAGRSIKVTYLFPRDASSAGTK